MDKWEEISLSDVQVGDRVYSVLRGWGEVESVFYSDPYPIVIRWAGIIGRYTSKGYKHTGDIHPEITLAERIVKWIPVQKEMWVLMDTVDNVLLGAFLNQKVRLFKSEQDAKDYIKSHSLRNYTTPCRLIWEE